MKVLKPFYYDDFKCIAGDCIDNCCHVEWEISIDKKTYKKFCRLKNVLYFCGVIVMYMTTPPQCKADY